MNKRWVLVGVRLVMGLLVLVAIGCQAVFLQAAGVLNTVNFLSYFTNLSNIVAGLVLIISALYLVASRKPSARDDTIRGAATLYMAVTGMVYVTLLSGEDLGLLMPWVNIVTHILAPLVVVGDWLYQPPRTKLKFKHIFLWLIFPAIYLIYTLIRGPIAGWYPYQFLNPDKVGGYTGVALYGAAILVAFFVLGWAIMKLGGKLRRHIG